MLANGYIDSPGPSQIGTALDWIGTGHNRTKSNHKLQSMVILDSSAYGTYLICGLTAVYRAEYDYGTAHGAGGSFN